MAGLPMHFSDWWFPALLVGAGFVALWWWTRSRVTTLTADERGGVLDAIAKGRAAGEPAEPAQALDQFFGASVNRMPVSELAPDSTSAPAASPVPETPRLTVHPLAEIIAQARGERRTEPGVIEAVCQPEPPAPADNPVNGHAAPEPVTEPHPGKPAVRDEGDLDRVRAELDQLKVKYKALDKESFIYTAHNKQLEAEIATLRAGLVPADAPSREELESLRTELNDARERLKIASVENQQLADKVRAASALAGELASARRDLAAAEELLRSAGASAGNAASLPGEKAAPDPVPPSNVAQLTGEIESLRSANTRLLAEIGTLKAREVAQIPSAALAAAPQGDDLTDIKGIAKVIRGRLNEQGIFTFRQIALWTDDEVKSISGALGLKNRVTRDQWREQARKLHAERHGGPLLDASAREGLFT